MKQTLIQMIGWVIVTSLFYLFYSFIKLHEALAQAFSSGQLFQSDLLRTNPLQTFYVISLAIIIISASFDIIGHLLLKINSSSNKKEQTSNRRPNDYK